MTDWTKSTGSSGTMLIRDTGTLVEFWIKAGSSTFAYQMPWGYTVNGTTDNTNEFRFESGGAWQKIRTWTVSTDQTVTFRLFDTGTSGLGGPTTLSAAITRSTAPDAPSKPSISNIGSTSAAVTYTDGSNNGDAIDSRQVGYGTSSTSPQTTIASDRFDTISGLTPQTTYYVWARTHNSKGYSPWSARASFVTLNVPAAPTAPAISEITQTQVRADHTNNGTGGSAITNYQYGYSLTNSTPTTTFTQDQHVITGLSPGKTYYFSARVKNAQGFSAWSTRTVAKTIAGARVKVGATWKDAVPYVKVAGVWKLARPYIKQIGVWRPGG